MSTEPPAATLPRNFVRPCVLLLLREHPAHGYDLLERLPEVGYLQVDPGGVYRALRAMEQEGLVKSTWEPSGAGPPRRGYALTADGLDWLQAYEATIRETRRITDLFLRRYRRVAVAASPDERERAVPPG